MLSRPGTGGFTLVELLVGMTLLGVLIALGAPSMSNYLQNSKIANATSGYYSAIQTARTEAIRRNVLTQFVLTDAPFSTHGSRVGRAQLGGSCQLRRRLRASRRQGRRRRRRKRALAVLAVTGSASAGHLRRHDRVQRLRRDPAAQARRTALDIKNPAAGVCKNDGGTIRCRRIIVSPGGQIAACDPAAAASAGDSRACPP